MIFHHIMYTCCVPYARLSYISSYVPTGIIVLLKPMQLAFCHTQQIHVTFENHTGVGRIIFSLRMGRFAKFYSANMSFATNLPNFPTTKVSSVCLSNIGNYRFNIVVI